MRGARKSERDLPSMRLTQDEGRKNGDVDSKNKKAVPNFAFWNGSSATTF
ncbi:hypothetical protein [Paraburkholderia phytofirmans]|nr:hypothetical protein [Paraburkholderia phytofirmans]